MKKSRSYDSSKRSRAASETRERILDASRALFGRSGIDAVTIAEIATDAGVAVSTVYALFASKTGILRALMERAMFNGDYELLLARLETVDDPIERVRLTASVACAIYRGETREISLMRGSSAFSAELREIEAEFETRRYELQGARVKSLAAAGLLRPGLTVKKARDLMWMLTSRDVFRMMVIEAGWSTSTYEAWLADALVGALTEV